MLDTSPQYAARKVKRAKWERAVGAADKALLEEAIRSDLTDETSVLSFWMCDDTEQSVDEVILAIASANFHLETTDVVLVPFVALTAAAEAIVPTAGQTPFLCMSDRHIDVTTDRAGIALMANLFVDATGSGQCYRMPRGRISKGIGEAVVLDGFINVDSLSPGIRSRVPELAKQ